MKKTLLAALFAVCAARAGAQINYENTTRIREGWFFLRGDVGNLHETLRSGKETVRWQRVELPHCFNASDAVDPGVDYYEGPGWYKTALSIENPYPAGRTLLHFEGAGQKVAVYVNGKKVGEHVGGYDEWSIDITDAIPAKGKAAIAIRCDNSRDAEMMPSDLSDFNLYGGLYRHLNLVYVPAAYVSGIHAAADAKSGELGISVSITGALPASGGVLSVSVTDPAGKEVFRDSETEASNRVVFKTFLSAPALWSPDSPNLYTVAVTLKVGDITTVNRDTFGFRSFEFIENGPFHLNGQRLLLRGTHRHEDHAGVAAAMSDEQIIHEMEMIKAMGANFIRLGHYQQSRLVLEQCSKLGLLVWEEIPWCRGGLGGEAYQEQGRRMLTNMIIQHRNHPSVILWGLGNENDWPGDFASFDKPAIRAYMKELHALARTLDPTRLTSIRRCDFCKDIPDVYSPTIWAGWYSRLYTDYREMTLSGIKSTKRFFHAEWGGDSHAGRHAEYDYASKDWPKIAAVSKGKKDNSETYICDLIDWHLTAQLDLPQLTGAAYWPFKDFSTPLRGSAPVPFMNQKGVVERDLTPKQSFYVFQSHWASEPMIHLYAHPVRWGKAGEIKLIKVYSNCETAELFLNGKSLGVKTRTPRDFPCQGLRWEAAFEEGQNTLKAIGQKDGKTVVDAFAFIYTSAPFGKEDSLRLALREAEDGSAWVEAALVDREGHLCLTSTRDVHFDLTGDGSLIVDQGTADASRTVGARNGTARVKVRKNGGASIVSVKAKGLKTAFIEVK